MRECGFCAVGAPLLFVCRRCWRHRRGCCCCRWRRRRVSFAARSLAQKTSHWRRCSFAVRRVECSSAAAAPREQAAAAKTAAADYSTLPARRTHRRTSKAGGGTQADTCADARLQFAAAGSSLSVAAATAACAVQHKWAPAAAAAEMVDDEAPVRLPKLPPVTESALRAERARIQERPSKQTIADSRPDYPKRGRWPTARAHNARLALRGCGAAATECVPKEDSHNFPSERAQKNRLSLLEQRRAAMSNQILFASLANLIVLANLMKLIKRANICIGCLFRFTLLVGSTCNLV